MSLVSVIIPCYNHGAFIEEALKSLEAISDRGSFEVIIVNDGSTDKETVIKLEEIEQAGYQVIHQQNQGLSAARNTGIKLAKGTYILPLDSDNRIRAAYITEGVRILDAHPETSVVYGDAELFGEAHGIRKSYSFNLQRLMLGNYIDACAMFRKKVWEDTGGYDQSMRAGSEDWEFWLHAAFLGHRFHYEPQVLFDYRVLGNSMAHQLNRNKQKSNQITWHLIEKHKDFYGPQFIDQHIMENFAESPAGFIGKLILKRYFPSYFKKLVGRGKLRPFI